MHAEQVLEKLKQVCLKVNVSEEYKLCVIERTEDWITELFNEYYSWVWLNFNLGRYLYLLDRQMVRSIKKRTLRHILLQYLMHNIGVVTLLEWNN